MKTQCFVKTCNGQGPHENRTEEGVRNVASGGGLFVFHHPTMGMLQLQISLLTQMTNWLCLAGL